MVDKRKAACLNLAKCGEFTYQPSAELFTGLYRLPIESRYLAYLSSTLLIVFAISLGEELHAKYPHTGRPSEISIDQMAEAGAEDDGYIRTKGNNLCCRVEPGQRDQTRIDPA